MSITQKKLHKRVNITLPSRTLGLIDRVAERGERSRLIDEAVRYYVKEVGRTKLRKQLQAGAVARADRDLGLAEQWFGIETEAWQSEKA